MSETNVSEREVAADGSGDLAERTWTGGSKESGLLIGNPCPECDVEIDAGSLRWNGFAWEHKNPNVHPQAGHHIINETQPGPPESDEDTDYVDQLETLDELAKSILNDVRNDVDLDEETVRAAKRHLRGIRGEIEAGKVVLVGPENVFDNFDENEIPSIDTGGVGK